MWPVSMQSPSPGVRSSSCSISSSDSMCVAACGCSATSSPRLVTQAGGVQQPLGGPVEGLRVPARRAPPLVAAGGARPLGRLHVGQQQDAAARRLEHLDGPVERLQVLLEARRRRRAGAAGRSRSARRRSAPPSRPPPRRSARSTRAGRSRSPCTPCRRSSRGTSRARSGRAGRSSSPRSPRRPEQWRS